jgi:hypothetical protein
MTTTTAAVRVSPKNSAAERTATMSRRLFGLATNQAILEEVPLARPPVSS